MKNILLTSFEINTNFTFYFFNKRKVLNDTTFPKLHEVFVTSRSYSQNHIIIRSNKIEVLYLKKQILSRTFVILANI